MKLIISVLSVKIWSLFMSNKKTDISKKVKLLVWKRDHGTCVCCGTHQAMPNAHVFVRRSHGGLGIPENIATLCIRCHHWYDSGLNWQHEFVKERLHKYMYNQYPNLDISKLKEKKDV